MTPGGRVGAVRAVGGMVRPDADKGRTAALRIAVTGAGGRVGRAVVERAAADGHSVVAIDREVGGVPAQASDVVRLDLGDYEGLERAFAGCDALIHLAAINGPGRHPDHVVHDNNVVTSYHALRAAAAAGVFRVCQASSVNAIGGRFSRWPPRYDYFPVDEQHPCYPEDPYSLSKLVCEQQAAAIARSFDGMAIASLRLHGVVSDRSEAARWTAIPGRAVEQQLWGYTRHDAAARACLLGVTAEMHGHEAFYVVAPDTMMDVPSVELCAEHYPQVPIRGELPGNRGLFDCSKAEKILGWVHDEH